MVHARLSTFLRASALLGSALVLWINFEQMSDVLSFPLNFMAQGDGSSKSQLSSAALDPVSPLNSSLPWPMLESLIDRTHRNNTMTATTAQDWPKLDSLIEGTRAHRIKANVQFVLDFAIIAHPKTATTSTMVWLNSHDEILMHNYELHSLAVGRPAEFVTQMYDLPPGRHYKRGYKAPRDLFSGSALNALAQYWPQTRLIVGLRHPVWWFQSFYNFRVQMGYKMPPAESLLGKATHAMYGVSTDEAKFHQHLDHLGKTPRSIDEMVLLAWNKRQRPSRRMRNPIFLYEINQLRDTNETRLALFRTNLGQFLQLQRGLDPMPLRKGSGNVTATIDICDAKLSVVRQELMRHARAASVWIRLYFLKSPDVVVSSPVYFDQLLLSWMIDPCLK